MVLKKHDKFNVIAQECQEYDPIATISNLSKVYKEEDVEDAGCDSCIHFHHGECEIYQRESHETG